MDLSVNLDKKFCFKSPILWGTSNASLGKFGSKIRHGRLLIEDLWFLIPSAMVSLVDATGRVIRVHKIFRTVGHTKS